MKTRMAKKERKKDKGAAWKIGGSEIQAGCTLIPSLS